MRDIGLRLILRLTRRKYLFPFLHYIRGKESGQFCASSTDLCVEGFESSANTFAFNVLHCVRSDLAIARHKHVVANLKRADDYGVPTVILFRNPADCIPSTVSRFRPSLSEAVQRYLYFYQYVVDEMKSDVLLVSFEELTQEVEDTVRRIGSFAEFEIAEDRLEGVEERAKERIRCRTKQRANTTEQISLPREEREQKKIEIREELVQHPKYIEAEDLYRQLRAIHESQVERESIPTR